MWWFEQAEAGAALQLGFAEFFCTADARVAVLEWVTGGVGAGVGDAVGSPSSVPNSQCAPTLAATLLKSLSADQWIAEVCLW